MDRSRQPNNDIDIVNLKEKNNVIDNVRLTDYRKMRVDDFLYGNNTTMSDCGAFISPAIKQLDRFVYFWYSELDDDTRKNIVGSKPYKYFTNSPLWKYESSVIKLMADYTCNLCKNQCDPSHLVVHHKSYEHLGSELNYLEEIEVLCNPCHMKTHGVERSQDEQ